MKKTSYLARCSLIAAVYAVLTLAFPVLSYGVVQVRISEALCILPFYMKEAIPGLTIGCFVANLAGVAFGTTPWDMVIGTVATLIAAVITRHIKIKWLAPLPAVIVNGLFVGTMITYIMMRDSTPAIWIMNMSTVALGEFIACFALGLPLMMMLSKHLKGEKYES